MENELKIKMYSFTLDCQDPHSLAEFYGALMRWEVMPLGEDWACVYAPGTKQEGIPASCFNAILTMNRLYGRKSPKHNSKWPISILPSTIWKRPFNMQSNAEQSLQMNSSPMSGRLC